ncbi:MAG: hypothetical protein AAGI08_00875 [Bacteroidota bacterium]
MQRFIFLLTLLIIAGCAEPPEATEPTPEPAPEAVTPDDLGALGSDAVETLLEDEAIHVHRITLAAGDSLAPHDGGERVVYAVSAIEALDFITDSARETRSFEAGAVHSHEAGVHALANTGSTPAELVVFERRGTLSGEATESTDIPTPGEGTTDEVIFDNDFAEVHRVTLQPGAGLPPHRGYARAVYALTGYTVEFTGDDGAREERYDAGQAHAHAAGDHTVENAGTTVAEFLVVEFKR